MMMADGNGWRGIIVAPPNRLAGIGGALRHAFLIDTALRPLPGLAELLERLERADAAPPRGRR